MKSEKENELKLEKAHVLYQQSYYVDVQMKNCLRKFLYDAVLEVDISTLFAKIQYMSPISVTSLMHGGKYIYMYDGNLHKGIYARRHPSCAGSGSTRRSSGCRTAPST